MRTTTRWVGMTSLMLAATAGAGPKNSQKKAELERSREGVERISKACGCTVGVDFKFDGFPDDTGLMGAGHQVSELAEAAERQCQTKATKQVFCKAVAKVEVAWGGKACESGADFPAPELVDRTLRTIHCIGSGTGSRAIWDLFDSKLEAPTTEVGDSADEADPGVKTTEELARFPGSKARPDGVSGEELRRINSYWEDILARTDDVVRNCRSRPKTDIDWASFKGPLVQYGSMVCVSALAALRDACNPVHRDKTDYAEVIGKKVKVVRCHYDPNLKADSDGNVRSRYAFKDGVFEMWAKPAEYAGDHDAAYAVQFLRLNVR
ncbi:MAG: hypothetical protein JNJ54_14710 [Myxococcaceae bacterium]|nr:hypothetical protein [Myxococcaceae bacterium]